jgi:hypothetical protein
MQKTGHDRPGDARLVMQPDVSGITADGSVASLFLPGARCSSSHSPTAGGLVAGACPAGTILRWKRWGGPATALRTGRTCTTRAASRGDVLQLRAALRPCGQAPLNPAGNRPDRPVSSQLRARRYARSHAVARHGELLGVVLPCYQSASPSSSSGPPYTGSLIHSTTRLISFSLMSRPKWAPSSSRSGGSSTVR